MNKWMTWIGMAIVCTLVVSGCSNSDNALPNSDASTESTLGSNSTETPEGKGNREENSVELVPVPPVKLPAANPENIPEVLPVSENGAIAKNFDTPDISDRVIPYLVANRQELGACQDFVFDSELAQSASTVYRVGENAYLAHFVCGSTAYQPLQEYYFYEKTADVPVISSLSMQYLYSDAEGTLIETTERTMAGYSDFDPATQTISIFTKGRGLGDCGSLGFYRLEQTELKLDRFLAKEKCDGQYIEPIEYPQIYP